MWPSFHIDMKHRKLAQESMSRFFLDVAVIKMTFHNQPVPLILLRCLNASSQPFDALKSSCPNVDAIRIACCLINLPVMRMFCERAVQNHSHILLFNSLYNERRDFLPSSPPSHSSNTAALLWITFCTCVLPQPTCCEICLVDSPLSWRLITSTRSGRDSVFRLVQCGIATRTWIVKMLYELVNMHYGNKGMFLFSTVSSP